MEFKAENTGREEPKLDASYRNLWIAVIQMAIDDLKRTPRKWEGKVHPDGQIPNIIRNKIEAREWLLNKENDRFNCFENICHQLGLNADKIRKSLKVKGLL